MPEKKQYEHVADTHGVQRHDHFSRFESGDVVAVEEALSWLDAHDTVFARETRTYNLEQIEGGTRWHISTRIEPTGDGLTLGASRAARYSGLELRMGPPFADAFHYDSEGRQQHEQIMGQRARWVAARGAMGGCVAMMDHPNNPRHPVTWFARKNLLGAGLLMEGDLEIAHGHALDLSYAFFVFEADPGAAHWERHYEAFSTP